MLVNSNHPVQLTADQQATSSLQPAKRLKVDLENNVRTEVIANRHPDLDHVVAIFNPTEITLSTTTDEIDYSEWFASCCFNDILTEAEVLDFFKKHQDKIEVDYDNGTPLIEAAKRGLFNVVKALLEAGADATIDDNEAIIQAAAAADSKDCVEILIQHGANPEVVKNYGAYRRNPAIKECVDQAKKT
jgi:ankyrin repeat protein